MDASAIAGATYASTGRSTKPCSGAAGKPRLATAPPSSAPSLPSTQRASSGGIPEPWPSRACLIPSRETCNISGYGAEADRLGCDSRGGGRERQRIVCLVYAYTPLLPRELERPRGGERTPPAQHE